jgi:hypothetical protein
MLCFAFGIECSIAVLLSLPIAQVARAETSDVLLQAVSFAVTGSDANRVVPVDLANCIFRVKSNTYHFNNIYTDRISFQNLENKLGRVWTTVDLHGKQKIADISTASVQEPPLLTKDLNNYYREVYEANSTSYADYSLQIVTRESARLVKAWQYIYANGCKGMKSPF